MCVSVRVRAQDACVHICGYVGLYYMHIYINKYTHIRTNACMCVVGMYVCKHLCVHIYMHLCMHLCTHLCTYVYTHVCMYVRGGNVCILVLTYLCIFARMCVCAGWVCVCDEFMYVCMYAYTNYVRVWLWGCTTPKP